MKRKVFTTKPGHGYVSSPRKANSWLSGMLLIFAMLWSMAVHADVVKIGGVEVTQPGRVEGEGIEGYVSYNSGTIILKNVTIKNANGDGVYVEGNVSVIVVGDNVIEGSTNGMNLNGVAEIAGVGTLSVNAKDGYGIRVGNLTVDGGCTLNVKGKRGIAGYDGTAGETLKVINSTVRAQGSEASIAGMSANVTLQNCEIKQPVGATLGEGEDALGKHYGVLVDGKFTTDEVVIRTNVYGFTLGDKQVTADNAADILGDGTASYDVTTNTLTLKNCNIKNTGKANLGYCLWNKTEKGLILNLEGTNVLESTYSSAILNNVGQVMTITGQGELVAIGISTPDGFSGIKNSGELTIKDCIVKAAGGGGIQGGVIHFIKADVTAVGPYVGSVWGYESIDFEGCSITSPLGAEDGVYQVTSNFDLEMKGIVKDGAVIRSEVNIEPEGRYEIFVSNVRVTEDNAADILGDGKVSYDVTTNTLTLDNVDILNTEAQAEKSYGAGLYNRGVEDLILNVVGKCSITSEKTIGLQNDYSMTITGNGELTIKGAEEGEGWSGVNNKGTITFKDLDVTIRGDFGIVKGDITFNNVKASITGEKKASIFAYDKLTFKNCKIVSPTECEEFSANYMGQTYYYIGINEEVVNSEIIIDRVEDGVNTVRTTNSEPVAIYDITGMPVDAHHKGIVIVRNADGTNMKKVNP